MRVGIREQLAAVVLLAVLVTLAIVSIPTWIAVNGFVGDVKAQALALTASLKAAQVASVLRQMQVISNSISARILLQDAVELANVGNATAADWAVASASLETALVSSGFVDMLQARVYPPGVAQSTGPYLNVTKPLLAGLTLPYVSANGSVVQLGDPDGGYPPSLYPNLTYGTNKSSAEAFPGVAVTADSMLLLGPLIVNASYALISITQPIISLTQGDVIGYITVIGAATELFNIESSPEGLGSTGVTLIITPDTAWNRFNSSSPSSNQTYVGDRAALRNARARFVIPIVYPEDEPSRHSQPDLQSNHSFPLSAYPTVLDSYARQFRSVNNATALLRTTNENGFKVSTGAARPPTTMVDWVIVVEQTQKEALASIALLRKILVICVCSTIGLVLILVWPFAHLSVLPIRRLKAATKRFVIPPGYEGQTFFRRKSTRGPSLASLDKPNSLTTRAREFRRRYSNRPVSGVKQRSEGMFKIPGKIDVKRHLIKDELTDLTVTFNDMSDELMRQYMLLEDKVAERTKQLELSKKAAEAANESKTVFIANVSHELKTPLNGILGMCAVCMEDDDLGRIKKSLKTLYESGTLLLRLLEDLLNFAKHEAGQPSRLEETEFSPAGLGKQATAFFSKDARDRGINFQLTFIDAGPRNTELLFSRVARNRSFSAGMSCDGAQVGDLEVFGDQHRILQIVVNFITNGFKFTPVGGRVDLRIRFLGEHMAREPSEPGDSETVCTDSTGIPVRSRGGSVSPRTGPVDREPSPSDEPGFDWVSCLFEFEVQDTGQGIPEDTQQRIFEPFVQGENGLARKYGGAGLGLAICRQLATLMGGNISLKSAVGVGSTFTLHVPLKVKLETALPRITRRVSLEALTNPRLETDTKGPELTETRISRSLDLLRADGSRTALVPPTTTDLPPVQESPAAKDDRTEPAGLRVLLADDNATNLEVLSRMLLLEKVHDVQLAVNGKDAYEKVESEMRLGNTFDIIFMDIQMPEMDGIESTHLIREMGFTGPIVALSAFAEEGISRQCSEAGVDHFLSKPINRKAIKQALKTFCVVPDQTERLEDTSNATTNRGHGDAKTAG